MLRISKKYYKFVFDAYSMSQMNLIDQRNIFLEICWPLIFFSCNTKYQLCPWMFYVTLSLSP